MDLAAEKEKLEQAREQLVARLNYIAGQIALIETILAPPPPVPTVPGATVAPAANGLDLLTEP